MGGNPAGGLLLMLLALFLLVQFFRGELDWLFNLRAAVDEAPDDAGAAAGPAPAPPARLSVLPGRELPVS